MAQQRVLQLLRSNSVYGSKADAITAVSGMTGADGEIRLARYNAITQAGPGVKSLLCVYHASPNLPDGTAAGWTFIEDASSSEGSSAALQAEVNAIETAVGLNTDGSYIAPSNSNYLDSTTSVMDALGALDTAVDGIQDAIDAMDTDVNFTTPDDSKIIYGVKQVNGAVSATAEELSSIKVASVSGTNAAIAAEDTLGTALGKLQAQINAMDSTVTTAVNSGDVITSISETNGVVTANKANLTDVLMTGYSKDANATGALAATDTVEEAFSKLENTIAANNTANSVVSSDGSITVGTVASGADAGKTDIVVNVDNATIVKDSTSNAIKTNLKIAEVVTGTPGTDEVAGTLGTNVKKAYALVDGSGNKYGKQIDIYKDSALKEVYLGASTDTVDASTGIVTKNTVDDPQSMNFVYQLADGTYSITKIDVSKFLTESEFGDGLEVSNAGVVSVKIDTSSDNSGYLSVSSAGVALDGDAIDLAISNAAAGSATTLVEVAAGSETTADGDEFIKVVADSTAADGHTEYTVETQGIKDYVAGELAGTAISAAGDSVYIAAAVDANDNKKINVTGTYGAFNTPTSANNSLSATTNGIAKAEDVATAVNTVIGNLDGSATATAANASTGDFSVLTKVNEVDGVVQAVGNGANDSKEVLLKKVAATGAAGDVAVADTGDKLTATNVEAALAEIVDKADASLNSVSAGNGAIRVANKDGNKNQAISLVIAPHTAGTNDNPTDEANDMLSITERGLSLSNVWDCGVY